MASHPLIDGHLAALARHLPAGAVDELADGLAETWQHHLAAGLTPTAAARAAIAEFGAPDQIISEFVRQARGRLTARRLLATGPLVGLGWGASLVTAQVWTWPLPRPGLIAFAAALLGAVTLLAVAATSRDYPRTRLGVIGGYSLIVLDVVMIVTVAVAAPILVWPMAVAVPASLLRIGFTIRSRPRAHAI